MAEIAATFVRKGYSEALDTVPEEQKIVVGGRVTPRAYPHLTVAKPAP